MTAVTTRLLDQDRGAHYPHGLARPAGGRPPGSHSAASGRGSSGLGPHSFWKAARGDVSLGAAPSGGLTKRRGHKSAGGSRAVRPARHGFSEQLGVRSTWQAAENRGLTEFVLSVKGG